MISLLFCSSAGALALGLAVTGDQAPAPPKHKVELGKRPDATVKTANRRATLEPSTPAFVNATAIFPWSDGAIYHAYAAPGRITDIVLQPGETLASVASGDTARWIIGDTTSGTGADRRVHVLVKPFNAGLTTNLVITTDRRTYHVLLTSNATDAMAALSWSYPVDEMIAVRKAAEAKATAEPIAAGLDVDALRFDYVITGDRPAWRPLRVFDDGRQTFIEFPATLAVGEAPPLFVLGATGDAELVNYRVRGHFYVVDRLIDRAELRLGAKKQVVVRVSRIDATRREGRK